MVVSASWTLCRLQDKVLRAQKRCQRIGIITIEVKPRGKRSAGNPHATFDVAGIGDVAWLKYCGTRK